MNRRKFLQYWWLLPVSAALGFLGWLGIRSLRIKFGKPDAGTAKFKAGQKILVADIDDLQEIWDFKYFDYPISLGDDVKNVSSILIRTENPQIGGINHTNKHFVALSRVCTHLYCLSNYVKDAETAALIYNYRPNPAKPVLGCPCHFSVFDPEQAGKSVAGPAIKPLPRIQLKIEGKKIYAIGNEEII